MNNLKNVSSLYRCYAMMTFRIGLSVIIFLPVNFVIVSAEDSSRNAFQISERMVSIINTHELTLIKWASSPILQSAVIAQNIKNMSLDDIKKIDDDWIKGNREALAMELQNNEAGRLLKDKILSNHMLYTEAFLCDHQGAVVGEYPKTSDYWQGDEEKFIQCFNHGQGKIYIGSVQFDDSTQTISVQISVPVVNHGQTIGVLVVGLKNIK